MITKEVLSRYPNKSPWRTCGETNFNPSSINLLIIGAKNGRSLKSFVVWCGWTFLPGMYVSSTTVVGFSGGENSSRVPPEKWRLSGYSKILPEISSILYWFQNFTSLWNDYSICIDKQQKDPDSNICSVSGHGAVSHDCIWKQWGRYCWTMTYLTSRGVCYPLFPWKNR